MKIAMTSIPVNDPILAHEIYTKKLGFRSLEFSAENNLAVVVSEQEPNSTALLLEPCKGTFYEKFQQSALNENLPIIIFSISNVKLELQNLQAKGIKIRTDLDRLEYGLENIFEDGCGNLIMLQESK